MSETKQINVPDIGDFSDVEVIEVLFSVGDDVAAEDAVITLESEKATIEVPSPESGKIVKMLIKEGDTVSKGTPMMELEISDSDDSDKTASEDKAEDKKPQQAEDKAEQTSTQQKADQPDSDDSEDESGPQPPPVPEEVPTERKGKLAHASPSVRKFARTLGVDVAQVNGSGRKGRITKEDVEKHVKTAMQSGGTVVKSGFDVPPFPAVDFTQFGDIESQALTRIQKISGKYLHRNWVRIPHVTQYDEADVTELEKFRQENKQDAKDMGFNLTPLAFMVKALAKALKKFPKFNSSLDINGENLIYKKYFNIGIAVDTPDGLVVPVIRDCDKKEVLEIAKEMGEISERARDGKLSPDDMKGGCMSISSLGGIGGTAFTPIINAPEVAILGLSRSQMKPHWNGKEFEPKLMLPLSLSYDHRVIDGAEAARFIVYLSGILSDMKKMLL